jgi:hypothetical protein
MGHRDHGEAWADMREYYGVVGGSRGSLEGAEPPCRSAGWGAQPPPNNVGGLGGAAPKIAGSLEAAAPQERRSSYD